MADLGYNELLNLNQQGLNNLGQVAQQQAMQPASLGKMLQDSFRQAAQDRFQREQVQQQQAMAQQNYERQMAIAEETNRHHVVDEERKENRLDQQDKIARQDKTLRFVKEDVEPNFTGTPEEVQAYMHIAKAAGLDEDAIKGYFMSRAQKDKVVGQDMGGFKGASESEGGEGDFTPPVTPTDITTPGGFLPGTQYALKSAAATELARKNQQAEADRASREDRMASQFANSTRNSDNAMAMLGMRLAAAGKKTAAQADFTPGESALVDMIGTYRALPEKVLARGTDRTRIMAAVAEKYPDYKAGDAAQNYKFLTDLASGRPGTVGGTVDSTNRMIEHASDLAGILDKSSSQLTGWSGKLANIANYPAQMMTGNEQSFNTIRDKLNSETEKMVSMGVPHMEQIRRDVQNLRFTDPIDMKMKVLSTILDVGLAQTNAAEEKRRNILGPYDPGTSLVSPASQERVNRIYKAAGKPLLTGRTTSSSYSEAPSGGSFSFTDKNGITKSIKDTPANRAWADGGGTF